MCISRRKGWGTGRDLGYVLSTPLLKAILGVVSRPKGSLGGRGDMSPSGDGNGIFHRAGGKVTGVEWELQLGCSQFLGSHCWYCVGMGAWETLQGFLFARLG